MNDKTNDLLAKIEDHLSGIRSDVSSQGMIEWGLMHEEMKVFQRGITTL